MRDQGYLTADLVQLPSEMGFKGSAHTDWNFTYEGKPVDTAAWSDLKERQPFYGQLNLPEAHRGPNWDAAAAKLTLPADPAKVQVPPYYPDHPVVRADWASYLNSVMVLDRTDGVRKKFTQDQLNARGLQIYKDGKVIPISQLNKGDEITATVISQRAPEVVTEREVEATLAQAPAKTDAPAAKSEPPAAKTESSAVAPPPATPMATQSTAAAPAPAPAESSGLGTGWYVLIAVVIAAILFLIMRRRKDERPSP
jgi:hypothetical protein